MKIHPNRLAAIKKMARQAMPGPWEAHIDFAGTKAERWNGIFYGQDGNWHTLNDCRRKDVRNARFIAACVNLVFDIIKESEQC